MVSKPPPNCPVCGTPVRPDGRCLSCDDIVVRRVEAAETGDAREGLETGEVHARPDELEICPVCNAPRMYGTCDCDLAEQSR